jgi:dolichol kinase
MENINPSEKNNKSAQSGSGGCLGIFLLFTGIVLGSIGIIFLFGLLNEFDYKWNENLIIPIVMNIIAFLCIVTGAVFLRKS